MNNFDPARLERRIAAANTATELLPWTERPGSRAAVHSHWVFPIQSAAPDQLMEHLRHHGFDATRGASSLYVVDPPADRPELMPAEAKRVMHSVLYLPVYSGLSNNDLQRLARATEAFEADREDPFIEEQPVPGASHFAQSGEAVRDPAG